MVLKWRASSVGAAAAHDIQFSTNKTNNPRNMFGFCDTILLLICEDMCYYLFINRKYGQEFLASSSKCYFLAYEDHL